MTKTLTEQWRDGTLEQKYYYVKYFGNGQKPFIEIELKNFLLDLVKVKDSDKIEILAPVPNYDEYCNLVFQANKPKNPLSDVMMCYDTEREKKVVERLQEQILEANKLILWCARISWTGDQREDIFDKYLAKWGVK